MAIFGPANILLPQVDSLEKWAVIACDQFVSQPEYWQRAREFVADAPSALHLIWPEAELSDDADRRIGSINETMHRYLAQELFTQYPQSFIYVERTLLNGTIRRGVVGAIDLECYDYSLDAECAIRATEKTVVERIPPRVHIRKNAPLELPHVLLLCDDPTQIIFSSIPKDTLPIVYDFDLMAGGGHITGRLLQGEAARQLCQAIATYESVTDTVKYAVGDGNHSLASAKVCHDMLKTERSRYALVELENIHDDSQVFEPIHRIVKDTDPAALLKALESLASETDSYPLQWFSGNQSGTVMLPLARGQLPVGALQNFLDSYLYQHPGETDYIHGDESLIRLSEKENTIGFLLPAMDKSKLFDGIIADGVLPRKTFSMGHAQEKRYYLEAHAI